MRRLPSELLAEYARAQGVDLAAMLATKITTYSSSPDVVKWGVLIDAYRRCPPLKTWAGAKTLAHVIRERIDSYPDPAEHPNPMKVEVAMPVTARCGVDWMSSPRSPLHEGFSASVQKMRVYMRVGIELLAIVGASMVPLVSWPDGRVGAIIDGIMWTWRIEPTDEHGRGVWTIAEAEEA